MITTRPRDRKAERLAEVNLFRGCTPKELAAIARLTVDVDVPAGRVLCREGVPGQQFFVIVAGEASVTIGGAEVARLGAGSFFGELALLDGGRRVATVTAASPMHVLVLSSGEFQGLLQDVPAVTRRMLAAVGTRLRHADRARAGG